MARYKTKPCEIEAIQFTNASIDEVIEFTEGKAQLCHDLVYRINRPQSDGNYLLIETLEGLMKATQGDYIIRGLRGEYYPCKPDVFTKKYELLNWTLTDKRRDVYMWIWKYANAKNKR